MLVALHKHVPFCNMLAQSSKHATQTYYNHPLMPEKPAKQPKRTFQSPKGTRDFYPEEMLRRRYIVDSWRRVALRHGFEEIDGPTFEHLDLYTVKSGEGIVSELFSFQRAGGEDTYALRPEFTPTLARMYAARARQLPQPTKWFCVSNFFRAERPQRGRLREFFQWNCDFIGGTESHNSAAHQADTNHNDADGEIVQCSVALLSDCGLTGTEVQARLNYRGWVQGVLGASGVSEERWDRAYALIDRVNKLPPEVWTDEARAFGFSEPLIAVFKSEHEFEIPPSEATETGRQMQGLFAEQLCGISALKNIQIPHLAGVWSDWFSHDPSIVRGLAYYTGMVFEVIAEGERAVAGGGRYDNLIELFGGPPTPACGFGMGDVVLANLLDDRGLMPSGREMLEALSRPMPLRPDVFVVAGPTEGAAEQVVPLVARLRRGEESEGWRENGLKPWSAERYRVPPLHARRSYKATKNIGKLLADANACHARFAAIIENPERCTLKDLDRGEQRDDVPISDVGAIVAGVF